jgi:hypothetical protein
VLKYLYLNEGVLGMKQWSDFIENGDLPPGIHQATLAEVLEHFGHNTPQRQIMARRLEHIYTLAVGTGHLARFIIFGSFVTTKPDPGDVDIFLLMENTFDVSQVSGETALIFDHVITQNYEGASIFWIRRLAAFEGEEATVAHWQLKRDGNQRGIIEVVKND